MIGAGGSPSRFWRWAWPCLVGLVGLLAAHHPMLFSGFQRVQTDPVDSRFVNYVLEHGARWLSASPGHESFWSPPFFFPALERGGVLGHAAERGAAVLVDAGCWLRA